MKTHIELGISKAELAGLIKVRDYLRGPGAETFVRENKYEDDGPGDGFGLRFNMADAAGSYECGTVACIGGSLAIVMSGAGLAKDMLVSVEAMNYADAYVQKHYIGSDDFGRGTDPLRKTAAMKSLYEAAPGIAKLFYPRPIFHWDDIRPGIAAEAIDRFLNTCDPDWVGIAKKRGLRISKAFL